MRTVRCWLRGPVNFQVSGVGSTLRAIHGCCARSSGFFGRAVLAQVGGRGHQVLFKLAQFGGAQAGVAQPAHADGHVDALLHDVHHAVAAAQVDLQLRVLRGKRGHDGRQRLHRVVHRGADAQRAGEHGRALPGLGLGQRVLQVAQRRHGLGVQGLPGIGQAPRGAWCG
jgi:hypothetical protein